jgi:hypothetical protein
VLFGVGELEAVPLYERDDDADAHEPWRQQRAQQDDIEWQIDELARLVLHYDVPHVALAEQLLEPVHDRLVFGGELIRFGHVFTVQQLMADRFSRKAENTRCGPSPARVTFPYTQTR